MDLSAIDFDKEIFALKGPWEFYWKKLVTTATTAIQPSATVDVGKFWMGTPLKEGGNAGSFGYATYRIEFTGLSPRPGGYEIGLPWANNLHKMILLRSDGLGPILQGGVDFDPADQTERIDWRTTFLTFHPQKEVTYTLIIQVSNYALGFAGLYAIPAIGASGKVSRFYLFEGLVHVAACGVMIAIGIYCFMMWYRRHQDRLALMISGIAFLVLVRIISTAHFIINLFPVEHHAILHRLQVICIPGIFMLYSLFILSTLSVSLNSLILKTYVFSGMALMALPVFSPIGWPTFILPIYHVYIVGSSAGYVILISLGIWRRQRGIFHIFAGCSVVLVGVAFEMLRLYELISSQITSTAPIAISFFMIMHSQIIAKYAADDHSKAEYLSKNLGQEVVRQTQMLQEQKNQLEHDHTALRSLDQQKTRFFQNISHELRTPLTLIMNTLEQMLKSAPDEKRIETANKNAKRLYRLVNELLDFQRIESTKKELHLSPINLVNFIRTCSDYFSAAAAAKKIKVKTNINGHPLEAITDKDKVIIKGEIDALEKITFNYLSNAMKFSPFGSIVELGVMSQIFNSTLVPHTWTQQVQKSLI
ncbi:MAG: sensor histidine kinase [Oligoflexales bacterium]|nr:sensor histidine kinase [Oligoflexales bacterium]